MVSAQTTDGRFFFPSLDKTRILYNRSVLFLASQKTIVSVKARLCK